MENNTPSKLTFPVWDFTSTGPRLWNFFYIIFFFFSPPSMSHKMLLHPSHSLSRANYPYNFSTAKLPFVNHDSSRTVTSHYWYIHHNSKSPCALTELNERCNTKTGTLLFVGAQMMHVKMCKGQTEKERETKTTLETKINNIWTNYIQYIVGDPIMWNKILLLHGQTLLKANARPYTFISNILCSA